MNHGVLYVRIRILTTSCCSQLKPVITRADDSRGGGLSPPFVCVSDFSHSISKTHAARITRLGILMFHDEFWKAIYCGIKRSKVKVTSHKNNACKCRLLPVACTLSVRALFSIDGKSAGPIYNLVYSDMD